MLIADDGLTADPPNGDFLAAAHRDPQGCGITRREDTDSGAGIDMDGNPINLANDERLELLTGKYCGIDIIGFRPISSLHRKGRPHMLP